MKTVLSKFLPLAFLFAILSVGSAVWAQAIDKLPTSTSDGRAFTVLTEKEVDALPDADFDAYYKWRIRLNEAETKKHQARADEAARLHAEAKARADELELMNRILAHHLRYGNEINAERVQLQNELRNKSMMISNPIIEDFCNDYL